MSETGMILRPSRDARDEVIEDLRAELRGKDEALRDAKAKVRDYAASEHALVSLREVLSPLHQTLKYIFGEIDAAGIGDSSSQGSSKTSAVWESWKQKLSSAEGRAIDALLLHGEMTVPQLRIHVGCATRTAQNIASSLSGKGLAVRMGGKIRLKEL